MSTIEKCHFRLFIRRSDQIILFVVDLAAIAYAIFGSWYYWFISLILPVLTFFIVFPKSYQKDFRESFLRLSPEKQKRLEAQFVPPQSAYERPYWYFLDDGIIEFDMTRNIPHLDLALYEEIFTIERLENHIILNMRATAQRGRRRFSFTLSPGEEIPPILLEKTGCYVMKAIPQFPGY